MKNNIIFMLSCIMMIVSCKKHVDTPHPHEIPVPLPAPEKARISERNKEIASVLELVYQNDTAYAEVNATILSGYYADERVLLNDLVFPEQSDLYHQERFIRLNAAAGVFKRIFSQVVNEGDYPVLKEAMEREKPAVTVRSAAAVSDDVRLSGPYAPVLTGVLAAAIYFPYSDKYVGIGLENRLEPLGIAKATIVAPDSDANAAPGRVPYYCTTGASRVCYKVVMVDDNYADSMPTHIIETGARPTMVEIGKIDSGVPLARVYLGSARLTRQMDAFFSLTGNGGGSEIKVARLTGYLKKEDEQVTSFSGDMVTLDFTRGDIRNRRWKRVFSVWDPNWSKDDLQQVYAVYEDDTRGLKTFTGSLTTTLNFPGKPSPGKAQGEIGYRVEVATQDEIITQKQFDRASFFADGMKSQGWSYLADPNDFLPYNRDWPIYDGGTIWQYTLPWKLN